MGIMTVMILIIAGIIELPVRIDDSTTYLTTFCSVPSRHTLIFFISTPRFDLAGSLQSIAQPDLDVLYNLATPKKAKNFHSIK